MYNAIIILGPTACGKTSVSVDLAKALHTYIISADSVQIYKKLDIGSAKVTEEEKQGIKHYMIDIVEPTEIYSVSNYKDDANKVIQEMWNENKIPIITGGTGFYLSALINNNNYGQCPANEDLRQKYTKMAEEKGKEYLFSILEQIDMESAQKLHKNDIKRVIRAIEIFELTGKTKSQWEAENKKDNFNNSFKPLIIGLNLSSRDKLYDKINRRVDIMFDSGLVEEVETLYNSGLTIDNQSMQGIGYKEFFENFNGNKTLDAVKELIKLNTRHYAKRQLTYFNQFNIDKWFFTDIQSNNVIVDEIIELLKK